MANIQEVTTAELLTSEDFTSQEIIEELELRLVPEDHENEALRGFIRPTRPSL